MFTRVSLQGGASLRCCAEVAASLLTLTIPGLILSAIAAAVGVLCLINGDASHVMTIIGVRP